MKILVIGGNGRAGQALINEGLARHYDVTANIRGDNHSNAKNVLKKDLFDLTRDDIKDFDVIIDAFGVFDPNLLHLHQTSLNHLASLVRGTNKKLYIVGGAGSLYLDEAHQSQVMNQEAFPEAFYPLASNMAIALDVLRRENDVHWIYLSPALDFRADGERTGHYQLGREVALFNKNGESFISYQDYAIAMFDVIENEKYDQVRLSVITD